jgi:hypothetical protein
MDEGTIAPDWSMWSNVTRATRFELVMLANNRDPSFYQRLYENRREGFGKIMRDTGLAGRLDLAFREFQIRPDKVIRPTEKLSCAEFAVWAQSLSPPWVLPAEFPGKTPSGRVSEPSAPITTNTADHPFHSEELAVAVSVWEALYAARSGIKPKGGHKKFITDWLRDNHPGLSNEAMERIATLVNPNKRGGVPSTL